jgi:hypothetical protein
MAWCSCCCPSVLDRAQVFRVASETLCQDGLFGCRSVAVSVVGDWPGAHTLEKIYGKQFPLYRVNLDP